MLRGCNRGQSLLRRHCDRFGNYGWRRRLRAGIGRGDYRRLARSRRGDARAGKRTLPVRFSETTVITGYNVAVAAAYVVLVAGVALGILGNAYITSGLIAASI